MFIDFFGNETSVNFVSSRDLTKSLMLFFVILQLVFMFLSVLSLKLSFCADRYSDTDEKLITAHSGLEMGLNFLKSNARNL